MEITEASISQLICSYETLLFDAYGVLVLNGEAIPGAPELISYLNQLGKRYYIVTNDASRLPQTAARRFESLGLVIAEERIVSSGSLLKRHFEREGLKGSRAIVLGTNDSAQFVRNAGGEVVRSYDPEDFDCVIVADDEGYEFLPTINRLISSIAKKIQLHGRFPLILLNPDLIYPVSADQCALAAGSIALLIEQALRVRCPGIVDFEFVKLGKPYGDIFQEVIERADSKNFVMIGDQLATDIAGVNEFRTNCKTANCFNRFDSALVTFGVTRVDSATFSDVCRPTYLLRSLAIDL